VARRTEPASLVDVMPSVLDLMGVAVPAGIDGRSLFRGGASGGQPYAETLYPELAGCSPLWMTLDGRWKLIGGPAESELYDLQQDPAELVNLAPSRRSLVEAMSTRASALAARAKAALPAEPDPEAAERLRALGYVATAPRERPTAFGGPSPVTIVRDWSRLEAAMADLATGRHAHALGTLAELAEARKDASAIQSTYARVLVDSGKAGAAIAVYKKALARWPRDTALWHGLSVAARDAGLVDEAMRAEQAALALEPEHAPAQNGLGLLHADAGRVAEARTAFESAVALDPYAVSYWCNLGNARMAGGDAAAAEAAYREALRLDPASADGANGLGVVLVKTGRSAAAVPLFERVVAATPADIDAWLNLGIAQQELGERAAAAAAYRRVLAAPSRFKNQRSTAAQLLGSLGETGR
jgi:tetratricopeptide (TPR) repeat protein